MSTVVTKNVQVGTSGTPANNFTLYQPATPDGTVRLANGNSGSTTDLVTVNSSGNVGIGTTSPVYKLDVAGAMRLGAGADLSWGNTYANNGPTIAGSVASSFLGFYPTGAAGGLRMRIDSSGRVLAPAQTAFSAYSTPGGITSAYIVYGSALTNVGSSYNTANGLFTAPVAGTYFFSCTTFGNTAASTGAYFYTQFFRNGSGAGFICHSQVSDARNYETISDSIILSLAANDTVGIYFIGANGATEYGGQYSHFSGHLIG